MTVNVKLNEMHSFTMKHVEFMGFFFQGKFISFIGDMHAFCGKTFVLGTGYETPDKSSNYEKCPAYAMLYLVNTILYLGNKTTACTII